MRCPTEAATSLQTEPVDLHTLKKLRRCDELKEDSTHVYSPELNHLLHFLFFRVFRWFSIQNGKVTEQTRSWCQRLHGILSQQSLVVMQSIYNCIKKESENAFRAISQRCRWCQTCSESEFKTIGLDTNSQKLTGKKQQPAFEFLQEFQMCIFF